MVKTVVTSEEDTDPSECWSGNIFRNREETMKNICAVITADNGVAVQALNDCLNEDKFCESCCNSHIGTVLENRRTVCAKRCNDLRFGYIDEMGNKIVEEAIMDGGDDSLPPQEVVPDMVGGPGSLPPQE